METGKPGAESPLDHVAQQSRPRGPKTSAGKARVRLNAVRFGLTAATTVLPGLERRSVWEDFRESIIDGLRPEGAIETELADRVAYQFWRLRRVAAYETEVSDRPHLPGEAVRSSQQLPAAPDLDKVVRYEAHVSRQAYQALHELEALQARRHGRAAPLARVEIHGLEPLEK